jgi:hypothetical protein
VGDTESDDEDGELVPVQVRLTRRSQQTLEGFLALEGVSLSHMIEAIGEHVADGGQLFDTERGHQFITRARLIQAERRKRH